MTTARERNKSLVYLLLLLVLVSLAAHLLADLQYADHGSQTRTDSVLLHTALLMPAAGTMALSSATIQPPRALRSLRYCFALPFFSAIEYGV